MLKKKGNQMTATTKTLHGKYKLFMSGYGGSYADYKDPVLFDYSIHYRNGWYSHMSGINLMTEREYTGRMIDTGESEYV